jgi:ferredoxin--NADP+ reductase
MSDVLRVAVVGSGPSGLYAADALAGQDAVPVQVDVLERLPCPFGLVRYGVAPDHLSIRSVRGTLEKVLARDGVRFLGNVEVGRDVTVAELHDYYDAVVFSYGAASDRHLGIPGEDLPGSVAATDLVAWYTGHPEAARAELEHEVAAAESVVVVGVGNVAMDVVRVLAKTRAELEHTDMPEHVLDVLDGSSIREIHLLGRRGPAQAAFTTKELRELGELADADVIVDPADVELAEASAAAAAADKVLARNVEVVREWSTRVATGKPRRIYVRFLTRPVELLGDDHVAGVVVERTRLDADGRAHGTGQTSTIPAQLVVRSVGYRGLPLDGVPFDADRNVVPSVEGRVVRDGAVVPGEYVAGWIKRGPTGIIGTNKKDAGASVASLLADAPTLPRAPHREAADIDGLLASRGIAVVDADGWRRIDAAEVALGGSRGRDRTTLHDRDEMLAAGLG